MRTFSQQYVPLYKVSFPKDDPNFEDIITHVYDSVGAILAQMISKKDTQLEYKVIANVASSYAKWQQQSHRATVFDLKNALDEEQERRHVQLKEAEAQIEELGNDLQQAKTEANETLLALEGAESEVKKAKERADRLRRESDHMKNVTHNSTLAADLKLAKAEKEYAVIQSAYANELKRVKDLTDEKQELSEKLKKRPASTSSPMQTIPLAETPFVRRGVQDIKAIWSTLGVITRAKRADTTIFDAAATSYMAQKVQKGLKEGFQPIQLDELASNDKSDLINDVAHVINCLYSFRRLIGYYCMDEVFQIYTFHDGSTYAAPLVKASFDLFTRFGEITIDEVRESCKYYLAKGKYADTYATDLNLTREAVYSSIADPLVREKIMTIVDKEHEHHKNGPVALWHLLRQICSAKHETLITLRTRLYHKFPLQSYKDFDIEQITSTFMKVIRLLKTYGINVEEAKIALLQLLKKCPVWEFRNFLQTLENIESDKIKDLDALIETASTKYTDLKLKGAWRIPKDRRAFLLQQGEGNPSPPEKDDKDKKANVSKSDKNLPTHDRQGIPIDRVAPKKGAPHTRKNKTTGKDESWCGECKRWGSHPTDKHNDWKNELKERRKARAAKKKKKDNTPSASASTALSDDGNTSDEIPTVSRGNFASIVGSADPF